MIELVAGGPALALSCLPQGLGLMSAIDQLEGKLATISAISPSGSESFNHFGDGLYIRETRIKAGTVATTMRHRFAHPFFQIKGHVEILSETEGKTSFVGMCWGMTPPDTRRVVLAKEDTIMITVHPNPDNGRDIDAIAARILYPHENPDVPEDLRNQWRKTQHDGIGV